ncbi:MAG TPA: sigma-70 family RNA polymerase sigma factor [Planctomycetaceae bacterium]|nr:sigma-70 family RNA polymerase sigma factor [Planctomycetaceae bacterium]
MEPDFFIRLVDRHAAALELFAGQWTVAPADVVQESLLELCRQDPLPERIVPWLYKVVRNKAISAARSENRRRRHEATAAGRCERWFEPAPDAAFDAALATEALHELPDEEREIIVAHVWGGLSFEEIADAFDTSSSTAHRRYQAGLAALRERLGVTWLVNTGPKPG